MTRPTLKVELQKLDGTWVDVSSYVSLAAGVSITRGRGDEDSQPDAAELRLTFEATDKRFTHGDSTYGCRAEQPIYVAVIVNGVTYPRFVGSVASWPVGWDSPLTKLVVTEIEAFDRLARFARRSMRSLIEEQYLFDGPKGYWPLGEAEGARSAGDQTGSGISLLPSGTVTFGDATGPTDGLTAATIAPGASLSADISSLGLKRQGTTQGVSAEVVVSGIDGSLGNTRVVQLQRKDAAVYVYAAGDRFTLRYFDLAAVYTTALGDVIPEGDLSGVHHVGLTLLGDALTLYVDGVQSGPYDFPTPLRDGTFTKLALGSSSIGSGGATSSPVNVSHAAVYNFTATSTTPASRAVAVTGAAFGTDPGARLAALLSFVVGSTSGSVNPMLDTSVTVVGGTHTLAGQPGGDTSALDMMQDLAVAEGGVLDVTPSARTNSVRITTGRALMDSATSTPTTLPAEMVDDLDFTADTRDLANDATGSRVNGAQQRYRDAASIAKYGTYTVDLADLLLTSDRDVIDRLRWEVLNFKEVTYRVSDLPISLQAATTSQTESVLALDIGSRVQVTGLPSTSPVGATADLLVQGWTEMLTADDWTWEGHASSAAAYQVWMLGDPTWSVLGTTTKLGF